jgi:hypothetical protein
MAVPGGPEKRRVAAFVSAFEGGALHLQVVDDVLMAGARADMHGGFAELQKTSCCEDLSAVEWQSGDLVAGVQIDAMYGGEFVQTRQVAFLARHEQRAGKQIVLQHGSLESEMRQRRPLFVGRRTAHEGVLLIQSVRQRRFSAKQVVTTSTTTLASDQRREGNRNAAICCRIRNTWTTGRAWSSKKKSQWEVRWNRGDGDILLCDSACGPPSRSRRFVGAAPTH